MGVKTLLLTHNIDTLGQMSCNPAIGGIGKGHLVKEVDALGGAMALAIDEAGIQFRTLNASKGPAVRATRAQADRVLYRQAIRMRLENQVNLTIFQQSVEDLILEGGEVIGAVTKMGLRFYARQVVLTAGTFLAGRIHIGLKNYEGGRAGDAPANGLAEKMRELDLPVGRLKTGTPPRIDARTVDFEACRFSRATRRCRCFPLWAKRRCIRSKCLATLPIPMSKPMSLSVNLWINRRCIPTPVKSTVSGRVIVHPSKTR